MAMRLALAIACSLCAAACAHVVTNEQRLEQATAPEPESADVDALRCRDTSPEIQLARDAKTVKAERLNRYVSALAQAKATQERFEEEFRKDPDLVYGAQAEQWQHRKQVCVELTLALEHERGLLASEGEAPVTEPESAQAPAADAALADDSKAAKSAKLAKVKKAKLAKAKKRGKNERLARADE